MAKPAPEGSWIEQWLRAERLGSRLAAARDGRLIYEQLDFVALADASGSYKDDAIAFFAACYHLKDWLKKDPETADLVRPDIEAYMKKTTLAICADVANYSKHGPLDLNVRVDAEAQIRNHRFAVYGPTYEVPEDVRSLPVQASGWLDVRVDGKIYQVTELAAECLEAWKAYLTAKSLLPLS